MKYALLVAQREFGENAKTKGFWISIFLFPLILMASITVTRFLEEKGTPTRYFVLVDQSGEYTASIEKGLRRLQGRKNSEAFRKFYEKYQDPAKAAARPKVDLETVSAELADPSKLVDLLGDESPEALERFAGADAWEGLVNSVESELLPGHPEPEQPKVAFRQVALPDGVPVEGDLPAMVQALKPYLLGEKKVVVDGAPQELFAAILIPKDASRHIQRSPLQKIVETVAPGAEERERKGVQYWSANLADLDLRDQVERSINEAVREREYQVRGVDQQTVREVQGTAMPVTSLNPKKEEGKEEASMADVLRQWAPVGFVYLLWIAIVTVAQMLLNNTVEEKSNRIVEVLLSSVTPGELMFGKLLGIAAVGLTMQAAWVASLIGVLYFMAGPEVEWAKNLFSVINSPELLGSFVVYFVLGYLFYAGIFLAIGSTCNTLKEAQNFMGPVMVIMMVPLLTMMFIPKDPNGTLATILSWIPFYTPFVMMNRAAADPPLFDVVGTFVLMLAAVPVVLWLSGRVFRIGILRTGQPPKLLEMLRWLKG